MIENKQKISDALATLEISSDIWNKYMGKDIITARKGLSEIKTIAKDNWRRLVKKHHPDQGGDANMFRKIHEAWQCIKNLKITNPDPLKQIRIYFSYIVINNTSTSTSTFWDI